MDIPIYLPENNKNYDFILLLNENLKDIIEDWEKNCEGCKKENIPHTKKIEFDMINDYLIFSIQRCDFNRKVKNTSVIKFYNNLNLRNFVSPYVNKEKLTYKLKATLNHIGELNKGHYYCNINLGNEWFIFNDSVV